MVCKKILKHGFPVDPKTNLICQKENPKNQRRSTLKETIQLRKAVWLQFYT